MSPVRDDRLAAASAAQGPSPRSTMQRLLTLRDSIRKRFLADSADGPFSLHAKALAVRGTVPSVQ